MRAILIDARNRTVTEVDLENDPGDTTQVASLNRTIGSESFDLAHMFENGDTLYVDDEGLGKYDAYFDIGAHQPFAGNGVILGSDETGESRDVQTSIEEVRAMVVFLDQQQVVNELFG